MGAVEDEEEDEARTAPLWRRRFGGGGAAIASQSAGLRGDWCGARPLDVAADAPAGARARASMDDDEGLI
jgi:hypothetical protein